MGEELDDKNPTIESTGDKFGATRHLGTRPDAKPMPERPISPLDELIPWVIEFRVVGTAHMIQVAARESLIIGRADPRRGILADIDLTPYAAHVLGVSRQHARVSVKNDRVTIEDMNSANGTFLNGHVLTSGQEYRLRHGDQLSFGQLHLQVQFVVTPTNEKKAGDTSEIAIPVLGKGQQVLVVDDDPDVARVLGSILERAGFTIKVVSNAAEAVNRISEKMPDAIVFELMMPDMNGPDFVRYVRRQDGGERVPVIAVSGASGGFHINQAREAGADIVLTKPVGVDEIVSALKTIVQQI